MIRAKPWIEWGSKGPSFFQTAPRSHDDKGDVYLNPEEYAFFGVYTVSNLLSVLSSLL